MSEKIKETITNFSEWAKPNFISIIIFLICYMLMFLGFVMFSWAFGYWANAFYGMKFELGSCWQGITVVVAGFGGVAGLAKYGLDKYCILKLSLFLIRDISERPILYPLLTILS